MLDIKYISNHKTEVEVLLKKRGYYIDFTVLLKYEYKRRSVQVSIETLQSQRNILSKKIGKLKKDNEDCSVEINSVLNITKEIQEKSEILLNLKVEIKNILDEIPNIPSKDIPSGGKENNSIIRIWKNKPTIKNIKSHVELLQEKNYVSYEYGTSLSGNGYWCYVGNGALKEWNLINTCIVHNCSNGYNFILPPHILNNNCGYVAGQFPKFKDDVYFISDDQFLLPTAETVLVNLHRNTIFQENELSKKYCAYTPCYRKEAGSFGKLTQGTLRGHQFNKVELVQYVVPEFSDIILEEMVREVEQLVQSLDLHYRVVLLAANDCSFASGKTYDIEVYIPSLDSYIEVSSISNTYDFQARRGNIQFKRNKIEKNEFVHILNGSSLATSRLLPAIVEQHQ